MKKKTLRTLLLAAAMLGSGPVGSTLTIDDFKTPGQSALGTQWQGFTDQVMGGVSTIEAGFLIEDEKVILRMTGEVSLENNGGFVQVRLPLAKFGGLDATMYTGIAIETRGVPGSYYIHLRTGESRLPWQYYAAQVPVSEEWTRHEIPFSAFEAESIRRGINPGDLRSLAVVGAKEEFEADIYVSRIELY